MDNIFFQEIFILQFHSTKWNVCTWHTEAEKKKIYKLTFCCKKKY